MKGYIFCWIALVIISCQKNEQALPIDLSAYPSYLSDYFVFVSADSLPPLILPIDINWTPINTGYEREFKAWYGTDTTWPISYLKEEVATDRIPTEAWEHDNTADLNFNASARSIQVKLTDAPTFTLFIPKSNQWIQRPDDPSFGKEFFAFQTQVEVEDKVRSGWVIYERIRRERNGTQTGGRDFEAFFWIPVVRDNDLYHFQVHRDQMHGTRWYQDGNLWAIDTTGLFSLDILNTSVDAMSGRTSIPEQLHLQCPLWDIDILLDSKGGQVGYGPSFPNGLAYYRQSLLLSSSFEQDKTHGMLELILEDD